LRSEAEFFKLLAEASFYGGQLALVLIGLYLDEKQYHKAPRVSGVYFKFFLKRIQNINTEPPAARFAGVGFGCSEEHAEYLACKAFLRNLYETFGYIAFLLRRASSFRVLSCELRLLNTKTLVYGTTFLHN